MVPEPHEISATETIREAFCILLKDSHVAWPALNRPERIRIRVSAWTAAIAPRRGTARRLIRLNSNDSAGGQPRQVVAAVLQS